MKQGIDVASPYQPDTKAYFSEAKRRGYDFAIVKTTESNNYVNPKAGSQLINASLSNLDTHTYHFARFASNEQQAVVESDFYVNTLKSLGVSKDSFAMLDFEEARGTKSANTVSIITFFRSLINQGYKNVGFYSYLGVKELWDINKISKAVTEMGGDFVFWLARYGTEPGMDKVDVWQHSSSELILGVATDTNYDFFDKLVGKTASKPTPPTSDTFVDNFNVVWHRRNQEFTITATRGCNLRWGASVNSTLITTLPKGTTIYTDAYCDANGHRWVRQPRDNGFGYMAISGSDGSFGTIKDRK